MIKSRTQSERSVVVVDVDGVEPPSLAVLHRAFAPAFGDVERNRERGPAKLVSKGAVAAGNPLGQR